MSNAHLTTPSSESEQLEALMMLFTFSADNGGDIRALIQDAWFTEPPPSGVNSREFPPGPWAEIMGAEEVEGEIFAPERYIPTQEVEEELGYRGLREATIRELLCFAAAFPDEQRKRKIAAMGSLYKGCYAPYLDGNERYRSMSLAPPAYGFWEPDWAFLGIRKRR